MTLIALIAQITPIALVAQITLIPLTLIRGPLLTLINDLMVLITLTCDYAQFMLSQTVV
jgi:hypothetical protein